MRRISVKYAKPGMVLGRALYDSGGIAILANGLSLDEESLTKLTIYGIGEIMIEDWRVADVAVQPLISPELEAEAAQALRQLLTESQGSDTIDPVLLAEVEKPVYAMTRELFPEVLGEANAAGCPTAQEYAYAQPAKVAGLALLMGRRAGYGMMELGALGMAAILMDIGYLKLDPSLRMKSAPTGSEAQAILNHPVHTAELLRDYGRLQGEAALAVAQHHERWDGSGYPAGLRLDDMCVFARILSLADAYYELVSPRPERRAYMPHEAVEYVMAYSGELFDPQQVQVFSRNVPLYPTGVTVRLGSGEIAIVSDANVGHVGRPIVRICYDHRQRPVREPYDIDLSHQEYQDKLVVQVLDY